MNRGLGIVLRTFPRTLQWMIAVFVLSGALVGAPHGAAASESLSLPEPVRGDPADSLYRAAREALNSEEYAPAAKLFQNIRDVFPRSSYIPDTYYWEAFALYRIGGERALREALSALETQGQRFPSAPTRADASALAVRIQGILAKSGDSDAAREVTREAARATREALLSGGVSPGADTPCMGGEGSGIAALNALIQMDTEQAGAAIRGVLSRRDQCSAPLRQKTAILAASSLPDSVAEPILLEVVRSDPDPAVRRSALLYVAVLPAHRSVRVFEEVLIHSTEPELQSAALSGLAHVSNARGGEILRQVIEQPGWSDELKSRAIRTLALSPGNAEYLRRVYVGLEKPSLQQAVLESLGSVKSDDNRRWLLDRAADRSTPIELRKLALFSACQSMVIEPLLRLYQQLPDAFLRKHLLFVYAYRSEPLAADRLVEIAEGDPDPEIRQTARFWLANVKRDPRADRIIRASPDSAARP